MRTILLAFAIGSLCWGTSAQGAPPASAASAAPMSRQKAEARKDAKLREAVSKQECGSMVAGEKKNCLNEAKIDAHAAYQEAAPASTAASKR